MTHYKYDCDLYAIPSTYRKAEISFESKMWKEAMLEEMNSLQKNDTWELSELPKGEKTSLVASEYILRSKILKMELLFTTSQVGGKRLCTENVLTTMRSSHLL